MVRPARNAFQRYAGSRSSGRIDDAPGRQHRMPDERVLQAPLLDKVDLAAQNAFDFIMHFRPGRQPWSPIAMGIVERDENVHVTIGAKLLRMKDRSEQTQLANPPLSAKTGDRFLIDRD